MNYQNYNFTGDTDPTQLESAYQSLVSKQNYNLNNPNASPSGSNYFIPYGYHATTYNADANGPGKPGTFSSNTGQKSSTSPYSGGGGGKWICTELLRRGAITRKDYRRLAFAHAWAILRHPNFCYWYLKFAGKLVKDMNRAGYKWQIEGKEFFDHLKAIHEQYGLEGGFKFYRLYCTRWAIAFGEIPLPNTVHFGLFKFLKEKWFWRNLLRFEGVKS